MLSVATHTKDAVKQNTPHQRAVFAEIRLGEKTYSTQLRKIARHVGDLVRAMHPHDRDAVDTLRRMLERYSDILKPWAYAVSRRMLMEVEQRSSRAWTAHAKAMGYDISRELLERPIGLRFNELMEEQVDLITSLPLQAAQRVHDLVTRNLATSGRAGDVAKAIMETGNVTLARATTIARTETSRAATAFTRARAEYIGSTHYEWVSSRDWKVRPELGVTHFAKLNTLPMGSHRKLDGTLHAWADPPIADPTGVRAHPGQIWNCRCIAVPQIPSGY